MSNIMFPKKLKIKSDNTELELTDINTDIKSKIRYGTYVYTKAEIFLGHELILSKEAVDKMIKSRTAVVVD